eukprot:Tamp_20234.p1 GENE.Tamp_20234~~Tamp_20234.p1  ORF type:complete len:237 (+),score=77.59 Tamp_20234:408-1118(+)
MGNKFGKSKDKGGNGGAGGAAKGKVSQADMAILELKTARDKLLQYQKKVEGTMARNREIALQLIREGKKDKALVAMKRRKMQEKLIAGTDEQVLNMEVIINTVEQQQQANLVFDVRKKANDALRQMQKEVSLEAVEKLMEETEEAMAYQKEITELLTGNLTNEDDEEMEAELEALIAAQFSAAPAVSDSVPELPSVPLTLPAVPTYEPAITKDEQSEARMEEDDTPLPAPAEPVPA